MFLTALFPFFCYLFLAKVILEVGVSFLRRRCSQISKYDISTLGRWAVITGGNDGIGFGMARKLRSKGMNVLLISRSKDKLETAKIALEESDPRSNCEIDILVKDLSKMESEDFIDVKNKLEALEGGVGVFINNAGISYESAQRFEDLDASFIDNIISLNVRSVLRLTHIVYKLMAKEGRGAILCIGSGSSTLPSDPLYCVYSATKAAVASFCENLRIEASDKGVLVQCHAPLLIPSKLSKVREGFLSPNVSDYSSLAIECLEGEMLKLPSYLTLDSAVKSPYLPHAAVTALAYLMPRSVWNGVRYRQTQSLRARFLKKKEREQKKEVLQ